jgi:hypothetical protein
MPGLRATASAVEETPAQTPAEGAPAETGPHRFVVPGMEKPEAEIHIVAGSWETGAPPAPPEPPETEVFQRGQFMFNRRFFETKFSGFFGIVRREADKNKVLQVKTPHALFVAERISRIAANEVHFEVLRGDSRQEVMVPFAEIQEIQLKHKKHEIYNPVDVRRARFRQGHAWQGARSHTGLFSLRLRRRVPQPAPRNAARQAVSRILQPRSAGARRNDHRAVAPVPGKQHAGGAVSSRS